ncbi:MAG TPA: archaellin/type IV pilin N-terminal domain-containing protein, partial [Sulfolobales archaeon]|nr:archaellin/type IV pilin N-terminal domain-containing protein [Sulfolobales archaeon]
RKIRKGLEPLIAAIILIAITIVIAIAVAAWVLGVFGTSVGGSEQLVVYPDATLRLNNNTSMWVFNVTVYNKGSITSNITGVTVGNCSMTLDGGEVQVNSGATARINATALATSCSFINGVTYQVKIYTRAGNVYFTNVVAGS